MNRNVNTLQVQARNLCSSDCDLGNNIKDTHTDTHSELSDLDVSF